MPLNVVAKIGIAAALSAANMALTLTRKIEGPRLDDLKFSSGDYGASLPLIWGMRRIDAPIFWAEDLREVRQRRKTKGGKFNEYTYFGTWAVALAGHEIGGVRRIWFDTHLVYDLSGAGPVSPFEFAEGATIADHITVYTGTETQDPDPRIEATVEAEFGEGSCPAYRGTAYIAFKDIPLEKLGNRIPQVSVEVIETALVESTLTYGFTTPYPTPIPTGPRSGGGNGLFFVLRIPEIRLELVSETPFIWFTSVGMAIEYDRGTGTAFSAAGHPITTDGSGNVVATMTEVFSTAEGDVTVVSKATFFTDRVEYRVTTDRLVNVRDTPPNNTATFRTDFVWGAPPPSAPDYDEVVTDASGNVLSYTGPLALADIIDTPTQQAVKVQILGARTLGTQIGPDTGEGSGGGGVTLGEICAGVAALCGVEEYDFTDLDQIVTGWSATRGEARNMIEPLLDAYDSDIRPHDFQIQGVKRSGVAAGSTLATARFVGEPRYSVKVRQAAELPRAILIDFADVDADQQPNTVRSDRPLSTSDARSERKIDLTPLALDTNTARQLGNRYFRRLWNERKQLSFTLTAQELALEPGDVRAIELDGDGLTARCIALTVGAEGTISSDWRLDAASLSSLDGSAGAAFDGRDPSVVIVPLASKGFVLDTALLADADDGITPRVYALAGPIESGTWSGATIFRLIGEEYSDETASIVTSQAATWGNVSGVMPYANPNLWDRGTAITVTLANGTLTGCTEAAADADPSLNLAAIGADGRWEIVQFTVATLVSGMTYTVSGFKRGRRGTEWAAELHASGDAFVLLDNAERAAIGLSEVATTLSFKAVTAGRSDAGVSPFTVAFTGATMKPYAPTHLSAEKQASGDWVISAVRRTRIGGAWTGGGSIPLGEASESYRVTLGDGVTSVNKTVSSLPYTWTVADQTTDTGAEVMAGSLEYAVAQISATVGAGYPAEATA